MNCIKANIQSQGSCTGAPKWIIKDLSSGLKLLALQSNPESCLDREHNKLSIKPCDIEDTNMQWSIGGDRIASSDGKDCLDSLGSTGEASSGQLGMYGCHGGPPQKWRRDDDGVIKSVGDGAEPGKVCLSFHGDITQAGCVKDKLDFAWDYTAGTLRPRTHPDVCLDRMGGEPKLTPCVPEMDSQQWAFVESMT